jgi:hypothetical protein
MVDNEMITALLNSYRGEIMAKSPKSLSTWQANRTVMPAGVGSLFRLADPFPMVIKRAKGARVWDMDDNEYLDFMLGFSTMILGNTPDEVQEAIMEALPSGTHYGQCHEHEYEFAKLFCDMVPGVDKVTSATRALRPPCMPYGWRGLRRVDPWWRNSRVGITGRMISWQLVLDDPARMPMNLGALMIRRLSPRALGLPREPGRTPSCCPTITRQPLTKSAGMPPAWQA